jgi:hypothetical protein
MRLSFLYRERCIHFFAPSPHLKHSKQFSLLFAVRLKPATAIVFPVGRGLVSQTGYKEAPPASEERSGPPT